MIKIQLKHTILQESRSGEMSKSSSCWLLLRPEDSSRCRVFSWELRGLHRRCQRGSYQTKYLMKTNPQVPYFEPKEECVEVPVEVCVQVEEQVKGVIHSSYQQSSEDVFRSCSWSFFSWLLDSSYFHSIHLLSTDHNNPPSLPQVPIQVCTVVDTEREPIVSTVIGTEYKTGKKGPPKPSKPLLIRYDMSVHIWTDSTCQWLDSEQSNCGNLWQISPLQSLQKRSWPGKGGWC